MHTVLEKMIEQGDGKYLGSKDVQVLLDYAQSVQQRIETYQSIQQKEGELLALAMEKVHAHPLYMNHYIHIENGRCLRDMTSTLRYCTTAMLLNDEQLLREEYLIWMETIMRSLKTKPLSFVSVEGMREALAEKLSQAQYKLMAPFINVFCDTFRM
jgi:Phycobilisome protein